MAICLHQVGIALLLNADNALLNKGALAEQFVGQELLAYAQHYEKPDLYFWARDGGSNAEVDYMCVINGDIIPVEVKSGKLGTLRSLQQFILERKPKCAVRIFMQPLSYEKGVLSIPLYLVSELERLVSAC